jgi:hypothetical protein
MRLVLYRLGDMHVDSELCSVFVPNGGLCTDESVLTAVRDKLLLGSITQPGHRNTFRH